VPEQQSGTEFQRTKEQQAAIMRQKQDEGSSMISPRKSVVTVKGIWSLMSVDDSEREEGCRVEQEIEYSASENRRL
jgi:hypothetical protein